MRTGAAQRKTKPHSIILMHKLNQLVFRPKEVMGAIEHSRAKALLADRTWMLPNMLRGFCRPFKAFSFICEIPEP